MTRYRFGLIGAALLLGLLAGSAGAQSFEGMAVVLEKDVGAGTIKVEPPIMTVHVTAETEILDLDGEAMTLSQLPTAKKVEGGAAYEVSGDLTIAFEAERNGEKVTATRIRRMQGTLD